VQNFVGKEVGQGGQGVDKVGHPRWGGRRPLVGAVDRAPPRGRRPRVAKDGRPLPSASGDRRSAAGHGSQPVYTFFFTFFSKKNVTFL
jgi:hypothetical protein